MPNKKRKKRIKEQKKRKKEKEYDDESDEDSDSGDSTYSYLSTTSTDGDEMEDRVFEKVLQDFVPRLRHRKREARLAAYTELYKLLTQKIRPHHFPPLKSMLDELYENIIKGLKRLRDDEEGIRMIPVLSLIVLIGYGSEEIDHEELLRTLDTLFEDFNDDEAKALAVRAIGLTYFLYGDSAAEDTEKIFNKYVKTWHKKAPVVWSEGVNAMSLLVSQLEGDERIRDVLPNYEGYFLGTLKRCMRYNMYEACGNFFAIVYDGCYRKKRKQNIIEVLTNFSRKGSRRLKMDEKKRMRYIISWIENEEDMKEVKLNGKVIVFDSWLKEVRYGYFKKIMSGGLNCYLKIGSPCVAMLVDILHLNKAVRKVEKKEKFLKTERMNMINGY